MKISIRKLCATGVLSAIGLIFMYLEVPIPIMPSFIKFDFSDLPALIASFAYGPLFGVIVCFVKNVFHLFVSQSAWIGELSNFLLGIFFVLPAGIIYQKIKTKKGAVIASFAGSVAVALLCFPINYFIIYPLYAKLLIPTEVILQAYSTILPSVDSLAKAILLFNVPFTFVKGVINSVICIIIYKKISPILKA